MVLPLSIALGAGCVLTLGGLVRGTLGFGDALVALPLLALLVEPQASVPAIAALSVVAGLGVGLTNLPDVDWRSAGRLLAGAMLGLPLGIWALSVWSPDRVQTALGVLLVLTGLQGLVRPPKVGWAGPHSTPAFGVAAGIFGGLFGAPGPAFVLWSTSAGRSPARVRATLQAVFVPLSLLTAAGHGLSGLWTPTAVSLAALGVPAAIIGTLVGNRLAPLLSRERFRTALWLGLLFAGAALAWP